MQGNRSKTAETSAPYLSAAATLCDWLRQEGGNQRIPQVLLLLAESTRVEVSQCREPPASEVDTLARLHVDAHGGTLGSQTAGRWLRRSEVEKWWKARRSAIGQACYRAGNAWIPELAIKLGGGRSNSTEYHFEFVPLTQAEDVTDAAEVITDEAQTQWDGSIYYQVEPAQTAVWLRWLSGEPQFHMRSWRGRLIVAMLMLVAAWILVIWLPICWSLWTNHPISSRTVLLVALAAIQTWVAWIGFSPLARLPWYRVTVAPDVMLGGEQWYGQFRLIRNLPKKKQLGWFSVVRHWAPCPICSADVDLRPGAPAFPGRLVGRCSDSPLEHVFSFDPVTLSGIGLIDQPPTRVVHSDPSPR